jgi:hypothetical protein
MNDPAGRYPGDIVYEDIGQAQAEEALRAADRIGNRVTTLLMLDQQENTMSEEIQKVTLIVNLGDDALPNEINEATTQLYQELLKSDAGSVEKPRSDTLEAGAKGDPITIGAIVLALGVAATPGIVEIVKNWLARRHLDTVNVKIKLGDDEIEFPAPASASPDDLEALTDRFAALLKKHSGNQE